MAARFSAVFQKAKPVIAMAHLRPGSDLKVDGYTWDPVDPQRVRAFMREVAAARDTAEAQP